MNDILTRLAHFPRDYYLLVRSGLFAHAAYSRCHFKTALLCFLALPHYLMFGEAAGLRPNAFFDPDFFARQSGTRRLIDYFDDQKLWGHPTSPYFDSRWYIEKHAAELATNENPLRHFLLTGFDRGYDPAPCFDMQFFRRAIARDHADRKNYAYEYFCEVDDPPVNIAELEKRETEFYASIELETLKRSARPERRFLVFIQSGRDFVPAYNFQGANFDILINYYDASTRVPDEADYVFRQKGTKVTAVRKILETSPDLLLAYDAVLFLDDDVTISQVEIETLFQTLDERRLDLLQASLSEESSCFFPVLKQPSAGKGLRPISAIEIMMPVISRRALAECGWVFKENISGWGIDTLLSAEVRKRFGNTIALLGDIVCVHAREVDLKDGAFYQFLRRHGIEPTIEAGKVAMKFDINDKMSAVHFLEPHEAG